MKKLLFALIILAITLSGCSTAAPAVDLRIITENNPPFNFSDETGAVTGQSTEIVKEIAAKLGITPNIEIMNWTNGYALAQEEANVMLYSTVRMPSREDMFKWAGPIGLDEDWFYSRSSADIKISSLDDARKVKSIAVYKDDRNQLYLSEKGFTNLTICKNGMECIKKLNDGQVDLWLGPAAGLDFVAYRAGVNPANLKAVSFVKKSEYYMAFNKNVPDSVVKSWQDALDAMKKTTGAKGVSRYEEITTSYKVPQYSTSIITRQQVLQLVDNTVRDIAADTPGTINKINSRSAPYLDGEHPELYIYIYDKDCTEVANASNPAMVGRSLKGVPDATGKLFRDKIVEGALNNGFGWENYIFTMPGKIGLFHKSAYYRLAKGTDGHDYIVGAGLYLNEPGK